MHGENQKNDNPVDGSEWSFQNFNSTYSMCWSVGSVSGSMSENNEFRIFYRMVPFLKISMKSIFKILKKIVRLNSSSRLHFQKNKAIIKNATQMMPNHKVSSSLNDWMCLKTTLTLSNLKRKNVEIRRKKSKKDGNYTGKLHLMSPRGFRPFS